LADGEVGKVGVPIDSLKSMEKLFEGIPLDSVSMFICVAMSTGPIVLALFLALAEKTGVDPRRFGLFMTNESLAKFRNSSGWQVGVDGSVALIDLGAGKQINTANIKDPVVGFIFGSKGLMYNLTLEGTKISRIKADQP